RLVEVRTKDELAAVATGPQSEAPVRLSRNLLSCSSTVVETERQHLVELAGLIQRCGKQLNLLTSGGRTVGRPTTSAQPKSIAGYILQGNKSRLRQAVSSNVI